MATFRQLLDSVVVGEYGLKRSTDFKKITGSFQLTRLFGLLKKTLRFELHCPKCGRSTITHLNWGNDDEPLRDQCIKGHEFMEDDAIAVIIK